MARSAGSRFQRRFLITGNIIGTLALSVAAACPVFAGEPSDPIAIELRKSFEADGSAPDAIDWEALNWDPFSVTSPSKQPSLKMSDPTTETAVTWDQKLNPDGSRALTGKKQLPTALDTKVGVDLAVAPTTSTYLQPGQLPAAPGAANSGMGAAWANVSVPNASVDARLDPQQDQAKLGTTLKKSVPLNDTVSVSVENGYAVTDSYAPAVPAAPTATATNPASTRVYSTDGTARLTFAPTGTTFYSGTKLSTADEKWRRSLGAEQKLFGGVNVSGAVSETDTGTLNRTISAGFKTNW